MRRGILVMLLLLGFLFACLITTSSLEASTILYDNGDPFPLINASSLSDIGRTHPFAIADQFTLTEPFTLKGIRFWGHYFPDNTPTAVDEFRIAIFENGPNDLPGATFANLPVAKLVRTNTGAELVQGFDLYMYEGSLHPFRFRTGGTYWLSIYNNTIDDINDWAWVYSGREGRIAYNSDNKPWGLLGSEGDLAFQLEGVPAHHPVPEPATMLLLGAGLIGLAGYSRKRLAA